MCQDYFPTVAPFACRPDELDDFCVIDFVSGNAKALEFLGKGSSFGGIPGTVHDSGIGLAGVCEGLALVEVDVEEPFSAARFFEVGRSALAVVEDMGDFVDDEVGEWVFMPEVIERYKTGRLFAVTEDAWRLFAERCSFRTTWGTSCRGPRFPGSA